MKCQFVGEIMIILVTGASHTGKTALAQKLLEKYKYPYLSIDHLKMGLIRSGNTELTPMDDNELTEYLWPIVREMIKTAIENRLDDEWCTMESVLEDNAEVLSLAQKHNVNYILIEDKYEINIDF